MLLIYVVAITNDDINRFTQICITEANNDKDLTFEQRIDKFITNYHEPLTKLEFTKLSDYWNYDRTTAEAYAYYQQ